MRSGIVFLCFVAACLSSPVFRWTQITPTGDVPSPRYDSGYALDSRSGKLYLFGGTGDNGDLNDFYVLDTATAKWTQIERSGAPSPRAETAGAFFDGKFYLIGGLNDTDVIGETWTYDAEEGWNLIAQITPVAEGTALITEQERLLYFGGTFSALNASLSATIFQYYEIVGYRGVEEAGWQSVPQRPTHPTPRSWFPLTRNGRVSYLFGGYDGEDNLNDLWVLSDAETWTEIPTSGVWPPVRSGEVMKYSQPLNSLVLFSGENPIHTEGTNDLWVYSLHTGKWQSVTPHGGVPPGRLGAGIVEVPQGILVFDGITGWGDGDHYLNDIWLLSWE